MLINKLKQLFSGQFIRNVGWLGGAELVNRLFRLATTVTLARLFRLMSGMSKQYAIHPTG
jgi:PST family polysaccharide transporter